MAVIRTKLEMNSNFDCAPCQTENLDGQALMKKDPSFLAEIKNKMSFELDLAKLRIKKANEEFFEDTEGVQQETTERVPKLKFGGTELCFYNIAGEVKDQRILPKKIMSKTALRYAFKKEKIAESKACVLDLEKNLINLEGEDLINTLDEIRRWKELIEIIENPQGPIMYEPSPEEDPNDVLEPSMTDEEIYENQSTFEAILSGEDDDFLSEDDGTIHYCGFCCQELSMGVRSTSSASCAVCDNDTCVKTCLTCNAEFCAECIQ